MPAGVFDASVAKSPPIREPSMLYEYTLSSAESSTKTCAPRMAASAGSALSGASSMSLPASRAPSSPYAYILSSAESSTSRREPYRASPAGFALSGAKATSAGWRRAPSSPYAYTVPPLSETRNPEPVRTMPDGPELAGSSARSEPASREAGEDAYDTPSQPGTVRWAGRVLPGECTDREGVRVLRPTNALDETSSEKGWPCTACLSDTGRATYASDGDMIPKDEKCLVHTVLEARSTQDSPSTPSLPDSPSRNAPMPAAPLHACTSRVSPSESISKTSPSRGIGSFNFTETGRSKARLRSARPISTISAESVFRCECAARNPASGDLSESDTAMDTAPAANPPACTDGGNVMDTCSVSSVTGASGGNWTAVPPAACTRGCGCGGAANPDTSTVSVEPGGAATSW